MLVATLVLSGILLIATLLAARYAKHPAGAALGWAAAVTVLPALILAAVFHVVWIQAGALVVGVAVCSATGARPRWIAAVSVASVLLAYGTEWRSVRAEERRLEALRTQYPFESLEERLPRPVPPSAAGAPGQLAEIEQSLSEWRNKARALALERLHSDSVNRFAQTPGLGVGRMGNLSRPTVGNLRPRDEDDAPPQQDYFRPKASTSEPPPKPTEAALNTIHVHGVVDFANPQGFGYVKDRRHVAGFQSHGFSRVPVAADEWTVATVDLVGLLLHDKPVVYVSEKLPRMEDLRSAPTRPLDPFEATGLVALQKGADLHTADGLRVLGALRNAQQCAACHEGDRGALLGAFSYRLRPAR
ncbi:Putative uncharacterized protein OS=Rhodopirellula baltica (strain SH1) GN=RB12558 PE=4 SV=1 [Gemmataceae bacterium]|nr:Putative uncharacterized protein OS=Rhodopirellula baltica (strain SH1) GN=RB12558 PE=4 SV=1 [Gemmataceae bacterium]VTT97650.1 Putative uncharacterized protein OS=Rhodopirellula baltica (strain SH1) GN=RB12558 PE=4 SV=1 [Gemmataceae bacterium]